MGDEWSSNFIDSFDNELIMKNKSSAAILLTSESLLLNFSSRLSNMCDPINSGRDFAISPNDCEADDLTSL